MKNISDFITETKSVEQMVKEGKQELYVEKAGKLLMSYIEKGDFADRVYEFAQDLCNSAINDIEKNYNIVGINGEPYTDDDDEMWYDEYREDFMQAVFEKLLNGNW